MSCFVLFAWNPIKWIMDNVVGPLIEILVNAFMPILQWAVELLMDLLMATLADVFYDIFLILLKIVSFLSSAFFVFAGVHPVSTKQATGVYAPDSFLLNALIESGGLTRVYWILTFLCTALCIIFTLVAIVRSMYGTDFDPKKTVGKILGRCGKTLLTFLVIPGILFVGMELASVVGNLLVTRVFDEGSTTVDNVIFLTTTMEAANNPDFNGKGASFTDGLRRKYFYHDGTGKYYNAVTDKTETTKAYDAKKADANFLSKSRHAISDDFDVQKIDFITGFILSLFMIVVLFGAALFAVRRIIEILLLYVAAPFFVAAIPLDEGKRFDSWRDMFVAKLVSCYGLILMMMMYLATVPLIMGADLVLDGNPLINSMMKTLLLLGGAFAVKNGHSILLGILSPIAAQHAQSSVGAGMGMAALAGAAVGGGAMKALGIGGGGGSGSSGGGGSKDPVVQHKNAADAQKFNG